MLRFGGARGVEGRGDGPAHVGLLGRVREYWRGADGVDKAYALATGAAAIAIGVAGVLLVKEGVEEPNFMYLQTHDSTVQVHHGSGDSMLSDPSADPTQEPTVIKPLKAGS